MHSEQMAHGGQRRITIPAFTAKEPPKIAEVATNSTRQFKLIPQPYKVPLGSQIYKKNDISIFSFMKVRSLLPVLFVKPLKYEITVMDTRKSEPLRPSGIRTTPRPGLALVYSIGSHYGGGFRRVHRFGLAVEDK